MDKLKILRSPSVKRRNRQVPIHQRVTLERVIGLTAGNNATLACDTNTGNVAYPAGCVVVLFNPKGNKQAHIFNSSKKTITSLAFSPDGNHIVTGESGHQPAVRVWDVKERTQVAEFHGHKFGIVCVKFSPNHKYLVSIGSQHDMMVNVWNWKTGTKVASNKISSKINSMAFSKDGSMFVTVGNRHVKFWYLDSSKSRINETVPLHGRSGILGDQKNNYFCDIACGKGKTVYCITQSGRLCQFNEKRLLDKWVELRTTSATCISAGEEYIFIGCANGVVRVFDTQTLHYVTTLPHPHPLGVDVASAQSPSQMVCQIPDAKFPDTIALVFDDCYKKVTCVYNDHSLYMWDVRDVKKVGKSWSFLYHSSCIWGLEVCPPVRAGNSPVLPPGSFITCSSDDTIRVWNLDPHMMETSSCKRNVYSHELLKILYIDPSYTYLRDVDYNPAGGTDKTDTNYDGKNGIRCMGISSDGKHLASGDRIGNIRVHNLSDMETIKFLEAHDQEVLCLQYANLKTAPNLLASSSRDRLVHVFDADQGYGLLQTLDDHSSTVTAIRFTDNENQLKMLSSSADKSVLFRNAQVSPTFQFVLGNQHVVGNNTLYDMDIEPRHKFVATACQDRNIRIYNIKSAKQKKVYRGTVGDSGVLIKLQLDPSGLYAATSCTDKNLCIIDFCTGELLATIFGHSEFATGVKFTNDLKHLISISGDGCIFVWRLPKEMTEQMKSRMEALGQELPVEAMNYNSKNSSNKPAFDESLGRVPLFPNEQDFKTPTKILAELTREKEEKEEREEIPAKQSLDFRYSVGQLPKWAKAKLGESNPKSPDDQTKNLPKGKWAERVDNKGLISQLDGKLAEAEASRDQKAKKFAGEDYSDGRRETMILPKAENTPRKVPVISDDSIDGGENDDDDDDDEDFFPSFHKKNGTEAESRWGKARMLSFNSQEDLQDDVDLDPEVIYPPSEASLETNESVYTVFTGMDENSKARRSSLKTTSSDKLADAESSGTDPVSPEELEEDDDSTGVMSTPVTPCEEFVHKTPDREKFLKETFENLSFTPMESDKFQKGLDELEKEINNAEQQQGNVFNPRQSFSTKFLSKAQQATIRNMAVYTSVQRQDGWFDSLQKKKDEMARAVDETRKRLMAMGWKEDSPEGDQSDRDLSPELPSPPIKLTNQEDNEFPQEVTESTPQSSSTKQDVQKSPHMPKSLRRCWSTFDLPKHPILEEKSSVSLHYSKSNPNTPVSKNYGKNVSLKNHTKLSADTRPQWRSRIPTPTAYITYSPRTNSKRVSIWDRPSESDSEESTSNVKTTPTSTVRQSRPTTLRLIKENNRKKHEAAEQAAKIESKYGQRSQSLSSVHRKQPESSKVKYSKAQSSSNLSKKEGGKSTPRSDLSKSSSMHNLNNINSNKHSAPAPKGKAKLRPSSKASHYASSPNLLANLDYVSDENLDFSSNLQLTSDLSLSNSTPDLLDDDGVKGPQLSEKKKATKTQPDVKRYSTGTPSRRVTRSTDRSDSNKASGRWSLPGKRILSSSRSDSKKDDKDLMPPPSVTGVTRSKVDSVSGVSKSKQDTFMKRATQARKKSTDLTLDQAKDILRGKSGILSTEKSSTTSETTTTVSNASSVSKVTIPSLSSLTMSDGVKSLSSSSESSSSSKAIPKVTSPPLHLNNNFLEIASEIELTADEIHRKSLIDSAFHNLASLDASPNDLPERDCDPPYSNTTSYLSMTTESSVHVTPISSSQNSQEQQFNDSNKVPDKMDGMNDSWTSNITSQSSEGEEVGDKPLTSVKDRIAQLNKQISPRAAAMTRSSSPKITPSTPMTNGSPTVKVSPGSTMSPRSSGVGSSLDSEAASKIFNSLSPPSDSEDTSSRSVAGSDLHQRMSIENALDAVSNTYQSEPSQAASVVSAHGQMPSMSVGKSTPVSSGRSSSSSSVVTIGGSPVPSPRKPDHVQACMEALKELRNAVTKVSNLYSQVSQKEESSEALKMLNDGFKEVYSTLSEIQLKPDNTTVSQACQDQSDSSLQSEQPKNSQSEVSVPGFIQVDQLLPLFAKNNEILVERLEKMFSEKLTSFNSIG